MTRKGQWSEIDPILFVFFSFAVCFLCFWHCSRQIKLLIEKPTGQPNAIPILSFMTTIYFAPHTPPLAWHVIYLFSFDWIKSSQHNDPENKYTRPWRWAFFLLPRSSVPGTRNDLSWTVYTARHPRELFWVIYTTNSGTTNHFPFYLFPPFFAACCLAFIILSSIYTTAVVSILTCTIDSREPCGKKKNVHLWWSLHDIIESPLFFRMGINRLLDWCSTIRNKKAV